MKHWVFTFKLGMLVVEADNYENAVLKVERHWREEDQFSETLLEEYIESLDGWEVDPDKTGILFCDY